MVDVADLKAKVRVEDDNASTVLAKLDNALEQIVDKLDNMDQGLQQMAKRGAESMGFLGHSMAFAFGGYIKDAVDWVVNGLKDGWDNAQKLAQNLDKLKFSTGMDVLGLQRMKAVLEQNNVSFEDFLGSLGRVQDMMARMRYNKLSQEEVFAFGRLGINPREYKSAESLLQAIGDRLNRINDIGERNFLAGKLKISTETLRGLTASGWYDEFAALTNEEKDKMAEYARIGKALDQEKSALFTKFVAKFITKDGIEAEKLLLRIGGAIGEIIDKSNSVGEVFDGLSGKLGKFFEYDPKDSPLMSVIKTLGQIGTGWSYLIGEAFDAFDKGTDIVAKGIASGLGLLPPSVPESTTNLTNQTYNNNRQANITINNTGTVDWAGIKNGLEGAGFGSVSYAQTGGLQ